jgi:hypothetical protein
VAQISLTGSLYTLILPPRDIRAKPEKKEKTEFMVIATAAMAAVSSVIGLLAG